MSHHVEGNGRRGGVVLPAVQGGGKRRESCRGRGHDRPMGAGRRLESRLRKVPRRRPRPPPINSFRLYGGTDGAGGKLGVALRWVLELRGCQWRRRGCDIGWDLLDGGGGGLGGTGLRGTGIG